MTPFFNSVKKLTLLIFLLCLLGPANLYAENGFLLRPVHDPGQVRLLAAGAWPAGEEHEALMFKLAYIRGMIAAWQLSSLAPKATSQVLDNMEGTSLLDLVRELDSCYQDKNNQLPPGSALLRIISPNYKEGTEQHE